MFSAVYAVLLAPQPIRAADRLVVGWGLAPERSHGLVELTYRDVEALGASSQTCGGDGRPSAPRRGRPCSRDTASRRVSPMPASAGRSSRRWECRRRSAARFNRRTTCRAVRTCWCSATRRGSIASAATRPSSGARCASTTRQQTVVGVMPAGFDYPRGAEFWAPLAPGLAAASALWKTDALANVGVLFFVARLKDGVSVATAGADLSAIGRRLDEGRPGPQVGSQVALTPLVDHVVGPARQALWALLGAVMVLLLIACVNVSGLMLTRASHARRAQAIQLAMGASDRALARQWLVEAGVLARAGRQRRHRAGRRAHPAHARAGARRHPAADRGGAEPPGRGHRAGRHRAGRRGLPAPARYAWPAARTCSTPCSRRRGRRRRHGRCGCARCSSSCRWRWPWSCSSRPAW